jgi:chemotaxis protein MotB
MKFSEMELKSLNAAPISSPPNNDHAKTDAPIRGRSFKKRKKKHRVHGAWKIVYADFVTVMMAFFIVVWVQLFGLTSNSEKVDLSCIQPLADSLEKQIQTSEMNSSEKIPLQVNFSSDGLRLTLLDGKTPTFQSGGSKLSNFAVTQFQMLATHINTCPTHQIRIEGYTDAEPYQGGQSSYTNWELSIERANAARRELIIQNVDIKRVGQVIGYGDSVPALPDDPKNALNRRISITVIPPKEDQKENGKMNVNSSQNM